MLNSTHNHAPTAPFQLGRTPASTFQPGMPIGQIQASDLPEHLKWLSPVVSSYVTATPPPLPKLDPKAVKRAMLGSITKFPQYFWEEFKENPKLNIAFLTGLGAAAIFDVPHKIDMAISSFSGGVPFLSWVPDLIANTGGTESLVMGAGLLLSSSFIYRGVKTAKEAIATNSPEALEDAKQHFSMGFFSVSAILATMGAFHFFDLESMMSSKSSSFTKLMISLGHSADELLALQMIARAIQDKFLRNSQKGLS